MSKSNQQETKGGVWVACSERLPGRSHADSYGDVIGRSDDGDVKVVNYRALHLVPYYCYWLDTTVEIVTKAEHEEAKNSNLNWAVARWREEVEHRPLRNEYRRVLDGTWRQIIRQLGGNDIELCGPTHDSLILQSQPTTNTESGKND